MKTFRAASRPPWSTPSAAVNPKPFQISRAQAVRWMSQEMRSAIDKAVGSAPVVLFMKGTPETPQCGFSRASVQILGMQGVDPKKFAAFNVLEDQSLREGERSAVRATCCAEEHQRADCEFLQASKSSPSGRRYRSSTSTRSL